MKMTDVWFRNPIFRFLVVGGLNTLVTGALVVILSHFTPGWLAFTISFALGISFSVVMTGRWVFQSHLSPQRTIYFVGAYFVVYLVGIAVIQLLQYAGAPVIANALSVAVTAPLSFIAGRLIFRNGNPRKVN